MVLSDILGRHSTAEEGDENPCDYAAALKGTPLPLPPSLYKFPGHRFELLQVLQARVIKIVISIRDSRSKVHRKERTHC